ncbi:FAD-binding oxidoreductase [Micromonospora polyrhachis]
MVRGSAAAIMNGGAAPIIPSMKEPEARNDYHSLLGLHHSMLLRRSMRGGGRGIGDPAERSAMLLDGWPQRLSDQRMMQDSLSIVEPFGDTLMYVYTVLFRDSPHLRSLFPDSIVAQRDQLSASMRRLIGDLHRPDVVVPYFQQLGQAHRRLGVRAAHFQPFGDALLEALRTRAGGAWRSAYDQAWQRAYHFVTRVMSDAAQAALSAPPYVTATVVHHQQAGPDLAVIRVRPAQPYPYVAGQYATIESPYLPHNWRCYSMADPPGPDNMVEFHVRATGAGRLSDVLVNKVTVGDELRLAPARGMMTLAGTAAKGVLLVAGGTGLAPIRALLGELARQPSPPPTRLFFGARTFGEIYELELLDSYAARYPWLQVVRAVAEGAAYPYESGTVVDVVTRRGSWAGHHAYLSGPAGMVTALAGRLAGLGVDPDDIRYDPQ